MITNYTTQIKENISYTLLNQPNGEFPRDPLRIYTITWTFITAVLSSTNLSIERMSKNDSQLFGILLRLACLGSIQHGCLDSLGEGAPKKFWCEFNSTSYLFEVEFSVNRPFSRDWFRLLPLVGLPCRFLDDKSVVSNTSLINSLDNMTLLHHFWVP